MKKSKFLLCAVILTAFSLFTAPMESVAKTNNDTSIYGENTVSSNILTQHDTTQPNQNKIESVKETDDLLKYEDKILIRPKYNCDPEMLIPGNSSIDPKFLLKMPVKQYDEK